MLHGHFYNSQGRFKDRTLVFDRSDSYSQNL